MRIQTTEELLDACFTNVKDGHFTYIPKRRYSLRSRDGKYAYWLNILVTSPYEWIALPDVDHWRVLKPKTLVDNIRPNNVYFSISRIECMEKKRLFRKSEYFWSSPEWLEKIPPNQRWQDKEIRRNDSCFYITGPCREIWK